jgi:transposase-like protein
LDYNCRGITSDLDTSFTLAIERVYAEKPHQYCIKHALASLEQILGYRQARAMKRHMTGHLRRSFERLPLRKGMFLVKASREFLEHWHKTRARSRNALEIERLRELCKRILCARSQQAALDLLSELRRKRSKVRARKWKAVEFLERHWKRLMRHHSVKGLPRTNNMAETFNKQLKRRLKTIESFQHHRTAVPYMNLLVAYLRLKPYTDCRGPRKHLNGKSRLQAAGVKTSSRDWLEPCLKN